MSPIYSDPSHPSGDKAYVITGPTSGIGRRTALELARHGTVVLVGRDLGKLNDVRKDIERRSGKAVPVVCDLSDPASVRPAAARIIELGLPIVGLLNNAGVMQMRLTKGVLSPLAPFIKYWSNPKTAARVITGVLTDDSSHTGTYYDESGRPMNGSTLVHEPEFTERVVAETRQHWTAEAAGRRCVRSPRCRRAGIGWLSQA